MMSERAVFCSLTLAGALAVAGCSKTPTRSLVPPQAVDMDAHTLEKFQHEVQAYVEMRQKLLARIRHLSRKSTGGEVAAYEQALTDAVLAARRKEKHGAIFKPDVERAFRRIVQGELASPEGPAMTKEMKQGNPRVEGNPLPQNPTRETMAPVTVAVNVVYNEAAPSSSMPPSLLLRLPLLPPQLSYGFVGRALILRDAEAYVILDYIKDAVPGSSNPR
jgi:hypothetical protein